MQSPPIVVMADEAAVEEHLRICARSAYRINRSTDSDTVMVLDEDQLVLVGMNVLGVWFLRLNPRYYHHPFQPAAKDNE